MIAKNKVKSPFLLVESIRVSFMAKVQHQRKPTSNTENKVVDYRKQAEEHQTIDNKKDNIGVGENDEGIGSCCQAKPMAFSLQAKRTNKAQGKEGNKESHNYQKNSNAIAKEVSKSAGQPLRRVQNRCVLIIDND